MDVRKQRIRIIQQRAGITRRVALEGLWWDSRRQVERWLCRHIVLYRWQALNDADWIRWTEWVYQQEKIRRRNDYLCRDRKYQGQ